MLELRDVTKLYSGIAAVEGITFTARPGEITGYLGANGSGKSTTIRMIAGLIEPTAGSILFRGQAIGSDPSVYRQRLGYVPEEPHLYGHLTGAEYLEMVGGLRGIPEPTLSSRVRGFLELLSLEEARYVPISAYSKGMKQKVLLAAALLHDPELILLDEPFSGLDVNSALILRARIASALGYAARGLLYGVTPTGAITYAAVIAGLTAVSLAACLSPAVRTIRIDPIETLRQE